MSANSSLHHVLTYCFESKTTIFIQTAMLITNILLLLPFLFLIIYLSLQQWRQQRSSSTTAPMSHSDFFTYNMMALELISIFSSFFYCFGGYTGGQKLQGFGNSMFYFTSPGQSLIHVLTCLERYLAVVHPITYLSLRQTAGIRIRNISTGCIWLLCLGLLGLTQVVSSTFVTVTNSSIMVFCSVLVSFFSFSCFHILNHPGPGEGSGDRQGVDKSKQKAFHIILAIMVAELFRLVGILVSSVMYGSSVLTHFKCAVGSSAVWLAVPCGLVLPILFLQRVRKLPDCKHKNPDIDQIKASQTT